MARKVKRETQETVAAWAKDRDGRTPDETMHGFLDAAKELEVVWFTGEYFEVFEKLGETIVELLLASESISENLQDALNAAMRRRREA